MKYRSSFFAATAVVFAAMTFPLVSGCTPAKPIAADNAVTAEAEHEHPAEGPHGGQLIELGNEEYHGELAHDEKGHKVTIYILDGKAEKSVPIADKELRLDLVVVGMPKQFTLAAAPQGADPAGQSSRFESTELTLGDALEDDNTKGQLNVTVAGKPFVGKVEHQEHDEHHHHH